MLTLILPVRDWSLERVEYSIRSFQALNSHYLSEILVIDFGSQIPITLRAEDGVRIVRLEASVWSLSEAINAGVVLAANSLIAKTDADILISSDSRSEFDRLAGRIESGEIRLAMAQCTDLPQELDPAAAFEQVAESRHSLGRLRPKWGQGGLVLFSRDVWDEIGGFESRFTGWGNEDNDFAERVRRSGHRTQWADRQQLSIFHMWHPPSYAATGVLNQRQNNQRIARDDNSILRAPTFRHSNLPELVSPEVLRSVKPLVTLGVATTARPDRDRMITEAINSFRDQIDNDFEVLVVDNGSSWEDAARLKRTLGALNWTEQLRVEVEAEGSIPRSRNIISQLARGRYICVVDDDDIALPNRLADHLKVFQHNSGAHGSHGGWIDFDESTGLIERNQGKERFISTLLKGSGKITAHPASLYRTDVMRAVPYDEAFALGSDFDLALRLANNGFEVPHTNSYLTLRRYHSTNVTITGQSNQVSNGATARSRALASFDWQRIAGLEQDAKTRNAELYCRNQMSLNTLAGLIPPYVGSWQVFVPIGALSRPANLKPKQIAHSPGAVSALPGAAPARHLLDIGSETGSTLQRLLDIVSGDICTRSSGLNQPIFFRSDALSGISEARRVKSEIEDLLGQPVLMNAKRQAEIDRQPAFDWRSLRIGTGERMLQSERFSDLTDLLELIASLGRDSLLISALSVLADHDEQGEAYYLVSASIKGIENLQRLEFDLERRLQLSFHQIAGNGVVTELVPNSRTH
jgi:GT2 family glycosyltransferase